MRAIKMLAVAALALLTVSASAQSLVGITNQTWRYFATTGGDPGVGWQNVGFDDSTWLTGRGLFGNDTGYPYPFVSTFAGPSTGGPLVSFYRTTFSWASSPNGVVLTMTNYVDDGDVIYINGTEITRFNMPAGPADQNTLAPGSLTEPIRVVHQIILDSLTNGNLNPLINGNNVLAVSVHNNGAGSSDTVFGLSVNASQSIAPCTDGIQPTNRTILVGRTTTFTVVEQCAIPAATIQWYRNVGAGEELITGATGASYSLSNAVAGDAGAYYARLTNSKGTVDSRQAALTVQPDNQPPQFLSARAIGPGLNTFRLTTDEQLCGVAGDCGSDFTFQFNWQINQSDNTSIDLGVATITMIDPTTYEFTTSNPREPSNRYQITVTPIFGEISDLFGNAVPPGTFVEAPPTPTAISVGASGSALYTFDEAPDSVEFATFTWAGAANGTADTADTFNAKAVTLDIANINLPLAPTGGTPPAAGAQAEWASAGHYLITRPTGVEGEVIVAHLRNDSGVTKSALMIDYDLNVEIPVTEEVLGHLVYYSFSGAANTWQQISLIPDGGTVGHKSATLDLSATPWGAGTALYILFADDNGSGSPDNANEIDNFRATFPRTDISVSIAQSPSSVSTNEGATVELNVVAAGSPPFHYQWFKNGSPLSDGGNISGATTATLTITAATPGNAGSYFARVSNDVPSSADSAAATVTISLDTTRPHVTHVVSSPNGTTITVSFNEAVSTASAQNTANYTLTPVVAVSSAVLGANNTVTLTTAARSAGTSYSLRIAGVTDTASGANLIDPNPTIVSLTSASVVAGTEWNSTWLYNSNNLDSTAGAWKTPGYTPGADWGTGPALFGAETGAAGSPPAAPTTIGTPLTPNSVAATSEQLVTTYFRKSITLPALPAGARYVICHYTDDGFIAYLDGTEIYRFAMPAGAVTFTNRSTGIPSGDATMRSFSFTSTAGAHTLAVELHQAGVTTSDVLFGMEVHILGGVSPSLSISHAAGGPVNLSWTADGSWRLRGSAGVTGPYTDVAIPATNPLGTFSLPSGSVTNRNFWLLDYVCPP